MNNSSTNAVLQLQQPAGITRLESIASASAAV
jgi:hypothetical protein